MVTRCLTDCASALANHEMRARAYIASLKYCKCVSRQISGVSTGITSQHSQMLLCMLQSTDLCLCQGPSDAEATSASMEALLEQGYSLRLGLSELQPLQKLLGKVKTWEAQAQAVLAPGAPWHKKVAAWIS